MKKSLWKRLFFGISLTLFCIVLISASVRIQLVQLNEQKEQSKIQSIKYQNQLILKEHVKNFARNLSRFSKHYDQNDQYSFNDLQTTFVPEINGLYRQLNDEGIWSTNLEEIFEKTRNPRTSSEASTNLEKIAVELNKIADQLPKTDKTH